VNRVALAALAGVVAARPMASDAQTVPSCLRGSGGTQTLESQNALGYMAEGVAFQISRGVVGSILIFSPGAVPPGWRLSWCNICRTVG
jgi:hypothetical protein